MARGGGAHPIYPPGPGPSPELAKANRAHLASTTRPAQQGTWRVQKAGSAWRAAPRGCLPSRLYHLPLWPWLNH